MYRLKSMIKVNLGCFAQCYPSHEKSLNIKRHLTFRNVTYIVESHLLSTSSSLPPQTCSIGTSVGGSIGGSVGGSVGGDDMSLCDVNSDSEGAGEEELISNAT